MPDGQVLDPRGKDRARRQSAALPVLGDGAARRVVLITSRETKRWVVPKGWIEKQEAPHRSAAREAFEEAGLDGEADPDPLGAYAYAKRLSRGSLLQTDVLVFRFRVARLLPEWPERQERERRLFTPADAAALVAEPELAELLLRLSRE